jgi:hypothetical protein
MTTVQPFFRKKGFRAALGNIGETKFDEDRAAGLVPPPDGWIGERIPVWKAETVRETQARYLARPRPQRSRSRVA